VLAAVTEADLSNEAFPWLSAREIEIGYARLLALRVTYVGELGWELHVPMEHLAPVYDALWQAGVAHGIADFGVYAVESLRLEKCYRAWQADLTQEYTPLAAGLGRLVDFEKPEFRGRAALLREREAGPRERLVSLVLDEAGDCDAPTCAPVRYQGKVIGLVTSGGYGHRIGKSIALAYLRRDLAAPGTAVEIEILGERRAATVAAEPLYDPGNARPRM
jgi:dimethylglycine dehydrogenase